MKTTPMEDDLKILNVEYLSNHWSDLIKTLKLKLREPNQRMKDGL